MSRTESNRPVRGVALLGAGAVVSERHLPGMLKSGEARPASVFDPDRERAAELARRFEIPHVCESAAEAVDARGVEIVLVASPNSFHREQTELALSAGKHVMCEKPIALKLADARAMAESARRAGRLLFVGFHHRFSSDHGCVRRLLEAGVIGDVRGFHSIVSEPISVIPGGLANYRFNAAQGGGLTLIDMGSHRVDQMRALLGEVDEVFARITSELESHDLDDNVALSMRLRSGAIGSLAFQRFSKAFFSPCSLTGAKGLLAFGAIVRNPYQSAPVAVFVDESPERVLPAEALPWMRPDGWWGDSRPGWVELWPPRNDTFEAEWRSLLASIAEDRPAEVDAEDGYRALEIVLAAHFSAVRGEPVSLPLDDGVSVAPPTFKTVN